MKKQKLSTLKKDQTFILNGITYKVIDLDGDIMTVNKKENDKALSINLNTFDVLVDVL